MAVTALFYGKAFLAMLNKEIDWAADTIKVALCTSSYTPDQDTHDYFDDVTNEVTGVNYVAGGGPPYAWHAYHYKKVALFRQRRRCLDSTR